MNFLAVHMEERCVPRIPLPMVGYNNSFSQRFFLTSSLHQVGARLWLHHGRLLHDLHPRVRHLALDDHRGHQGWGKPTPPAYNHTTYGPKFLHFMAKIIYVQNQLKPCWLFWI